MALPILKQYGRSGMHGYASRTTESRMTAPMQLGSAVDALLFGHKRVVAYPGSVRRGKEWEAFAAANADSEIVTGTMLAQAQDMVSAIHDNMLTLDLLQGKYQETILFDWNGLKCRATPDVIGDGYLTELKTSQTSDPLRFPWHCIRMGYHAQMRMQNLAIGDTARDHYIVCVESIPPHPVTVYRLDEKLLEQGEKLLMLWSEKLKQCEAAQHWPGYVSSIVPIDLPEQPEELIFAEDEQ